jgi:acyl carrier protein
MVSLPTAGNPMNSVLARVRSLLQEYFSLTPEQTEPDRTLEQLGIESLEAVEFLFKLEEEFKISLSEERTVFSTVGDIVAIVEKAVAAQRTGA